MLYLHSILKEVKKGEYIDCVYVLDAKSTDVGRQLSNSSTLNRQVARNGNPYVILYIKDRSLINFEKANVFYYYKSIDDLVFLRDGYGTKYLKINGRVFEEYPNICISTNNIIPADSKSGIVFDTSELYPYNDYFKSQFTSFAGKSNIPLRHTSVQEFQDTFDIIDIGSKLQYKRLYDSPYDKFQINVFINDIDEAFNIPAYLTPTMAKMMEEGYIFDITVSEVIPGDEEKGFNAGIRVTIKGFKK